MPIRLDQFRSVSSGKWNTGSVVLDSGNSLKKVNNHKWDVSKNNTKIDASQNLAVRTAFYDSVREFLYGGLGVGQGVSSWNTYLEGLRARLFGGKAGTQELTRKMIRTELAALDNQFADARKAIRLDNANVKAADADEPMDDGRQTGSYGLKDWSWNYTDETGLSRKAINRICRCEGNAVRFLVNELAPSIQGDNVADRRHKAEVLALKRIAGKMALDESELGAQDSKDALHMLNGGFTKESLKANPSVAEKLRAGLKELSRQQAEVSDDNGPQEVSVSLAQEGDLSRMKLTRLRDGKLAVSYRPENGEEKSLTLGLPAVHYEHELERAIARLTQEDLGNGNQLKTMQDELFAGLQVRVPAGEKKPQDAPVLKHIRSLATIALTQNVENVTPAICEKISTVRLATLAAKIGRGEQVTEDDVKGAIDDVNASAESVEFKELQDCFKQTAKKPLDGVDKDVQILADVAYALSLGEVAGTAAIKKNFDDLSRIIKAFRKKDEALLNRLSPTAKELIRTFSDKIDNIDKDWKFADKDFASLAEKVADSFRNSVEAKLRSLADGFESLFDNSKCFTDETPPTSGKSTEGYEEWKNFDNLLYKNNKVGHRRWVEDDPNERNQQGLKFEDTKIASRLEIGSDRCVNIRKGFIKPELYACRTDGAGDGVQKPKLKLGEPYVKGDTFDLLAATITSPEQTKAMKRFAKGKKPSVGGANAVVNTMLKSLYEASKWKASASNDKSAAPGRDPELKPDKQEEAFNKVVEGLAEILSQPPVGLNKGVVRTCLSFETMRNNVENGAHEIAPDFIALLQKLPGATVSSVLKGLCREVLSRSQELYGGMEDNSVAHDDFCVEVINPVYEQMEAWRKPLSDDSEEIDFNELDPARAKEVKESFEPGGRRSNNDFVEKVLPGYLRGIPYDSEFMAKLTRQLVSEGGSAGSSGKERIDWNFFGDVAKGLGPIMQKFLQAYEIPAHASDEMRKVFKDLKDDLTRPSMDYVNAQIEFIKQSSGGRITDIEFIEFLGCATVGAAAKCRVRTVDNPKGEECVIKFLRPDVRNSRANEQEFIASVFEEMALDKREECRDKKVTEVAALKNQRDKALKNIADYESELRKQNAASKGRITEFDNKIAELKKRVKQMEFIYDLFLRERKKGEVLPVEYAAGKLTSKDLPQLVRTAMQKLKTHVNSIKKIASYTPKSGGDPVALDDAYVVNDEILVLGNGKAGTKVGVVAIPLSEIYQGSGKFLSVVETAEHELDKDLEEKDRVKGDILKNRIANIEREKADVVPKIELVKTKLKGEQEKAAFLTEQINNFESSELAKKIDNEYSEYKKMVDNLDSSNKTRFDDIEKELDFRVEHDGICGGIEAYVGKSPTVQSVDELSFVVPDSSFIIMKLADGATVNSDVRKADVLTRKFDRINNVDISTIEKSIEKSDGSVSGADSQEKLQNWGDTMADLLESREKLLKSRAHLIAAAEVWFDEALGPEGHGFFHGDLHAGNIMTDDKKATLIDFGNYSRLDGKTKKSIGALFAGVAAGDADAFLEEILKLKFRKGGDAVAQADLDVLKDGLKRILNGGVGDDANPELVFKRFSEAIIFLSKKGVEAPDKVKNFLDSQTRLANSVADVNRRLRLIDQAVLSAGGDGQWYLERWPLTSDEHKRHVKGFEDHADKLASKVFAVKKGGVDSSARKKTFDETMKRIRALTKRAGVIEPCSYGSVVGKMVKSWMPTGKKEGVKK